MDYPLTYEKLREYEFDLNAEVLWGMEVGFDRHLGPTADNVEDDRVS